MKKPEKEQSKPAAEDPKCRSCKRIEWVTFSIPRKLNSFIYSRRNLLVAIIIAVVSYFLLSGQPEMVRRVVATFTFAAGCGVLEVFPLPARAGCLIRCQELHNKCYQVNAQACVKPLFLKSLSRILECH
jgi:hypothetical protein